MNIFLFYNKFTHRLDSLYMLINPINQILVISQIETQHNHQLRTILLCD